MENSLDNFFNLEDFEKYKNIFEKNKKVKIENLLITKVAEILFKHALTEKNWILSTGHDATKYEKRINKQFEKANAIQIKKIQDKFKNDHFSYIFLRSMNNIKPSFLEYTLRKNMGSEEFIHYLNKITNLNLTKLNTLFLSKYKGGNFLSPHSDNGNGKLAFVLNLTKNWKPQYGGILHFMNDTKTEIVESFTPLFNNLMLFEVPEGGIPHFVSHVVPYVKQERYSITGWYE
tara:strand:+ start:3956 stop:4651 length:696 start_codon:yes stop_codon:yes gene_type:complete